MTKASTRARRSIVEVIGQPELAKRYGVSLATVWQWRRRYPDFPPPIPGRVAGAPAFDAAKVQAWYRAKWPARDTVRLDH